MIDMVQLGVMDSEEEKRRSCSKKQTRKSERKAKQDCSSVQGKEKFLEEENNRDLKQLTPCFLPLTLTVKRYEMSWTIDG